MCVCALPASDRASEHEGVELEWIQGLAPSQSRPYTSKRSQEERQETSPFNDVTMKLQHKHSSGHLVEQWRASGGVIDVEVF